MSNEEKERGPLKMSWQSEDVAAGYAQVVKKHQNALGEATQLMLEAAAVREGSHILDIAARNVGPKGTVLAADISAEMLKVAAHVAEQEGFTTITTRVMNAEQLDLADETFDAVISRLGLMLVHLQKALREILRVLKLERKLAALVWSTPDRHPAFSMPLALATKYGAPTTLSPDPFALGGSGIVEQALSSAGFHDVSVQAVSIQSHFASWEAVLQINPMVPNVIKQLNQQDQQRWQEEIKQAMSPFDGPEGLIIRRNCCWE